MSEEKLATFENLIDDGALNNLACGIDGCQIDLSAFEEKNEDK